MKNRKKYHKKRKIGYQLKRRYKNAIRKQLEQELYLLSQKDISSIEGLTGHINNDDTLFIKRNEDSSYSLDSDMYIQNGYASSSALLLTIIRQSKNSFLRECYIFPALFCLRQYLELTMKDSILFFRLRRRAAYAGESNLEGHDLVLLWNNLKMYFDNPDSQVNNVERLIFEFNSYDSNGELFRYGSSLTKKILNKNIDIPFVDVDILYKRVIQLYSFFEGVNSMARDGFDEIATTNEY
ncbi:MAG: hypothetical protein II612_02965 [Prevotella sp.]|nr:hypothetical protein [Prevotella sp.]